MKEYRIFIFHQFFFSGLIALRAFGSTSMGFLYLLEIAMYCNGLLWK